MCVAYPRILTPKEIASASKMVVSSKASKLVMPISYNEFQVACHGHIHAYTEAMYDQLPILHSQARSVSIRTKRSLVIKSKSFLQITESSEWMNL
jgi:hypothetical protein